jgi:methylenetetrahydrofolate reductase (NADPH)
VKAYGVDLAAKMCRRLLDAGVPGLHFYTLNLEKSVTNILEILGFVSSRRTTSLPWMQSSIRRREKEDVRPIFWANRPRSYLDRTALWDEFPNGRWGHSASPAYGDLSDYHLCSFFAGSVCYPFYYHVIEISRARSQSNE